jgi:hypothetical protein
MEGRGKTEDSKGAEDRQAKNSGKRNERRRILVEDGV